MDKDIFKKQLKESLGGRFIDGSDEINIIVEEDYYTTNYKIYNFMYNTRY